VDAPYQRGFFDFVSRCLEDLDLHRLLAHQSFELADALVCGPELTSGHHVVVRRDGSGAPLIDQLRPTPDDRGLDIELATELCPRQSLAHDAIDLIVLPFGTEMPPPVRPPPM
jgi:hypothetical protein